MLVVSLPFAAHAGPYLHGALRADGSSLLPICLLLLMLACPFLCESAPQGGGGGHSCRLLIGFDC